jgi:hypothetical protein
VEFGSELVQIQVCVSTDAAAYSFRCPGCRTLINRPAGERVLSALTGAGVRVVRWSLPAELAEPKIGPPITHDDLLAFHLALDGDEWRTELAGLTGP